MTSSLCRSVIPSVPRILRSFCRIDSRLCSNESQGPNDKKDNNIPLESKKLGESADSPSVISLSSRYTSFNEADAPVILDVEEEKILAQQATAPADPLEEVFARISQNRGESGVFDIDELVEVLKLCRATNLCVISVPESARYVDYMCIVNGKSIRHMSAVAQFVRRVYKKKRLDTDPIPKIEGKTCKNWMALDLGNIALHIFSPSARQLYDLESLWALGPELDPNSNKKEDDIVSLLQRHSLVLDHLQPAG